MEIEFKCQKCQKLLSINAAGGTSFKCPHCGVRQVVPEALASLPTPLLSGRVDVEHSAAVESEEANEENSRPMAALANSMPWVISAFLHCGVFMLTMFIVFMIDAVTPLPISIPVPDATLSENPGATVQSNNSQSSDATERSKSNITKVSAASSLRTDIKALVSGAAGAKGSCELISQGIGGNNGGGGAPGSGDMGLGTGASAAAPRSSFIGSDGGNCTQVIYVIDRSGSMADTLDTLKYEMIKSISTLRDTQQFHIIFYAEGKPIEMEPSGLKPATREYKYRAADFVKNISAERSTNPVPAIRRAMDILSKSSAPNKIIYFLTDGRFDDPKAVEDVITRQNSGANKTMINTFLYGQQDATAAEIMRKIAKDNGGRYYYVDPN